MMLSGFLFMSFQQNFSRRRELIQEVGPDRMRLKALKENTVLPQAIRDEAAEKLHGMSKYSHPRLVLNMCMFTGRQRGKIKPYRVNRHLFRYLFLFCINNYFPENLPITVS